MKWEYVYINSKRIKPKEKGAQELLEVSKESNNKYIIILVWIIKKKNAKFQKIYRIEGITLKLRIKKYENDGWGDAFYYKV